MRITRIRASVQRSIRIADFQYNKIGIDAELELNEGEMYQPETLVRNLQKKLDVLEAEELAAARKRAEQFQTLLGDS